MLNGLRIAAVSALAAAAILVGVPVAHAQPDLGVEFGQRRHLRGDRVILVEARLLVGTPAPDWVKAAQLEGGDRAVVVPKMVYRVGFFRPPRGSSVVTGPETHEGDRHTAVINASRQGAPTIQVPAEWRRIDGRWKLASKSLCNGIKTLGLPIPCNFQ